MWKKFISLLYGNKNDNFIKINQPKSFENNEFYYRLCRSESLGPSLPTSGYLRSGIMYLSHLEA